MRNIVIIGNGFDRAHNLLTDYESFVRYLIMEFKDNPEDPLVCEDNSSESHKIFMFHYRFDFSYEIKGQGELFFKTNNDFLCQLIKDKKRNKNWSDIEAFYFKSLKDCKDMSEVSKLHVDFEIIKKKLIVYLKEVYTSPESIKPFRKFFNNGFFETGVKDNNLILNFNYTDTLSIYNINPYSFKVDHVHGKLDDNNDDSIVFGHDMSSNEYKKSMSRFDSEEYYQYIKSKNYQDYSNFDELKSFLNKGELFNVFVFGHSLSLSDNQMLKLIFENNNLKTVSLFYFKDITFFRTQRHNIDKIMLSSDVDVSDKVLGINHLSPMPQLNDVQNINPDFVKSFDGIKELDKFKDDFALF